MLDEVVAAEAVEADAVVGAAEPDGLEPVDDLDQAGVHERVDAAPDRGACGEPIVVGRGDADGARVADQPGDAGAGLLLRQLRQCEERVGGGVTGAAVADRWGTRNYGSINGVFAAPITAVTALGPALGPVVAAGVGSYAAMALIMAGFAAIALVSARFS